jgi:hypothetical protein
METALAGSLKVSAIQNIVKVDTVSRSHNENLLTLALLQQFSTGANAAVAAQVAFLVQYRDVLEALITSASIVRQDAWTFWNYNELLESRVFDFGRSQPDTFEPIITGSKSVAMDAYFLEAQLDVMLLYVEASLENMVHTLLPNVAVSSTGSASSIPQSFLEVGQSSGSINSPADILNYLKSLKSLVRVLNFAAASSLMYEAKLEYALVSSVTDEKTRGRITETLPNVATTAATTFSYYTGLRSLVATTEAAMFATTLSTTSLGSLNSSGYESSFGADNAPVAAAAAVGTAGSLVASRGSVLGHNLVQESATTSPAEVETENLIG